MLRPEPHSDASAAALPQELKTAGLVYAAESSISRVSRGNNFSYRLPSGLPLKDQAALERIRALAIPPAWIEVWICPSPQGHIQATGRDYRGRKQYRYHAEWAQSRDETKFEQILTFAKILPKSAAPCDGI